ncbi:MAG TPA: hypothetical protein VHG92_06360, partial [Afifellaceae bacterium]|nr:hypothetical protein [Afifellaceae bacterium]
KIAVLLDAGDLAADGGAVGGARRHVAVLAGLRVSAGAERQRTGETPDGPLPLGAGSDPQSCQDCHMPSRAADGAPIRSKIASIQEYSNFPQAEHNLGPEDIDLPVREGFSVHTLVGLNVFLIKMAQQFPDILGIRTQDPMLGSRGVDPLVRTEQAMLDLAGSGTADLRIADIGTDGGRLRATVTLTSKVGHKFPSGVGFRRAFVEFQVLDQNGETLWASGRTNAAGALVDEAGAPIEGEYWWEEGCSARIRPEERLHQPHFQRITSQRQAQIYQELVSTPPEGEAAPICGHGATPEGQLTTSFLSICAEVKDNRILPKGYLPADQRIEIARALGAGEDLGEDAGSTGVGDDPHYVTGGGDSLVYEVPLAELPAGSSAAAVQATLFYQATPPFYLQDRFCTAKGEDTERLKFLVGHLNLDATAAEGWKLEVVSTGRVPIEWVPAARSGRAKSNTSFSSAAVLSCRAACVICETQKRRSTHTCRRTDPAAPLARGSSWRSPRARRHTPRLPSIWSWCWRSTSPGRWITTSRGCSAKAMSMASATQR